jgi:Tfp pilus assembly protein PilE
MRKLCGFTLIELIIFLIIMGIIALTVLEAFNMLYKTFPSSKNNILAIQKATGCMEWFVGQRFNKNIGFTGIANNPPANFCPPSSGGYNIQTTLNNITIGGDNLNFKKVVVTVSGAGSATLSMIIANY